MNSLFKTGPIFTDLYELTMAETYFSRHITAEATFSLFIRDYPPHRNYFVAAGLSDAMDEMADFCFSQSDLDYLKQTGYFSDALLHHLNGFRFTGTVRGIPEGSIFFANEPLVEVTAPIIESQLMETFLINAIGFPTIVATKAARCMHAAKGRPLVDFSLRRTPGADAGLTAARSSYIAGFSGTSNVLAGKLYGIPVSGTMAHSFVSSFKNEIDAFSAFSEIYPDNTVLLIDTYDTIQGAKNAVTIGQKMKQNGKSLIGVRIDSGDMVDLSRKVRHILDDAGLGDVKIFASSSFDEYLIDDVLKNGACIDAFGVGTKLGVSADAPYLEMVYKIVRFDGRNVKKHSPGKVNLAGEKQVFRKTGPNGIYETDIIGLKDDMFSGTAPLLETLIDGGRRVAPGPSIDSIREKFKDGFSRLPDRYKSVDARETYPVLLSDRLQQAQKHLAQRMTDQ